MSLPVWPSALTCLAIAMCSALVTLFHPLLPGECLDDPILSSGREPVSWKLPGLRAWTPSCRHAVPTV